MSPPRAFAGCRECATRARGVFRSLDGDFLDRLEVVRITRRYERGQILYYEGNPCTGIHCVRSGRVKLARTAPGARTCILRVANPGDILGLGSLFSQGRRYASTAQMVEEGIICHVDAALARELVLGVPEVSCHVVEFLACRLRRAEAERVELGAGGVRERTARALLGLARQHGRETDSGTLIDLALSREEIAGMVGAAAETVIRQLSEFRGEELVDLRGRQIVVRDAERLRRVAHGSELSRL